MYIKWKYKYNINIIEFETIERKVYNSGFSFLFNYLIFESIVLKEIVPNLKNPKSLILKVSKI